MEQMIFKTGMQMVVVAFIILDNNMLNVMMNVKSWIKICLL